MDANRDLSLATDADPSIAVIGTGAMIDKNIHVAIIAFALPSVTGGGILLKLKEKPVSAFDSDHLIGAGTHHRMPFERTSDQGDKCESEGEPVHLASIMAVSKFPKRTGSGTGEPSAISDNE